MSRTILLVSPKLIARGDFNARGVLRASGHASPPAGVTDMASLTLAALGLVKGKPAPVWLLTTAAATAVLETAPGRFRGLSDMELASALAFEAESMTGLPAMNSLSAGRLITSDASAESWWVTQMANRSRGEIEAEIVRRGTRLEGIAHPGSLAVKMNTDGEKFELWHDLLFIHKQGSFDILPVDDTAPLNALLARFSVTEAKRVILTPAPPANVADVEVLSLHDDSLLRQWLTAWHQALETSPSAVPVLLPPALPMSAMSRAWLSVATAAVALALCGGHWWWTEHQLQQAQTEIKAMTTLAKQREELQKTSAEMGRLRQELESSQRLQAQALMGFGALLSAVASLCPEGLLVRTLKEPSNTVGSTVVNSVGAAGNHYTGMEVVVTGICTHQELAAEFSRALGSQLMQMGWSVRPARTTARLAGGTPAWDFEIPLRLNGTTTTASPSPTAANSP